ncbi:hypothetical protein [Pseudorhodoplanes sp.]|uniref:hypothetical protein n=1 Tax=Pseudorhodoplanes sp. TaxID=1934341 RepID=UPI002B5CEB97|nr:hypothetical protein [Pseudorhodoplanes sp.]HWV55205.1 hypothetical protein [Pseudorhodoplanes sp.]
MRIVTGVTVFADRLFDAMADVSRCRVTAFLPAVALRDAVLFPVAAGRFLLAAPVFVVLPAALAFLANVFLVDVFLAEAFLADDFLPDVFFLAVVFLAGAFVLATALRARFVLRAPAAFFAALARFDFDFFAMGHSAVSRCSFRQ